MLIIGCSHLISRYYVTTRPIWSPNIVVSSCKLMEWPPDGRRCVVNQEVKDKLTGRRLGSQTPEKRVIFGWTLPTNVIQVIRQNIYGPWNANAYVLSVSKQPEFTSPWRCLVQHRLTSHRSQMPTAGRNEYESKFNWLRFKSSNAEYQKLSQNPCILWLCLEGCWCAEPAF